MNAGMKEYRKRPRLVGNLPIVDKRYYIFCEGEKTEPQYFEGFKRAIESYHMYRNLVFVEIHGLGKETLSILKDAEKKVKDEDLRNAQVWIVYDKDSNPDERFNAVSERAGILNKSSSSIEYRVAWSNQCIEYWFILHFDFYASDNDRKFYVEYLSKKFRQFGLKKYEKNDNGLFDKLMEFGNPKQAIKWSKRRIEDLKGCTDAKSAPATKLHELVEELSRYLPPDIKIKYRDD